MSMDTILQAFISPNDETYQKHKKVLLACWDDKVALPKETAEYFGDDDPHLSLLDYKLEIELEENIHYKMYTDRSSESIEILLKNLPKEVTNIRFSNNW